MLAHVSLRLRMFSLLYRSAAWLWRRLLLRTTFIAITGSVGKTTAKDGMAACLAQLAPTVATPRNQNDNLFGVAKSVLRVRPWHRFAVIETGIDLPGRFRKSVRIVAPDVAVILSVKLSHTKSFRTLEAIAQEKRQMLEFLRPGGLVVRNGDDKLVSAMPVPRRARVVTFGEAESCTYRFADATSVWPDRLCFTAIGAGESASVQTSLVGTHWVPSVMAAIAVSAEFGLSLTKAAAAVRDLRSAVGRMDPVEVEGATFLRNDFKGSTATFAAAIPVLNEARAARRILICSDLSDSGIRHQHRIKNLVQMAQNSAEVFVFLGERAELARKYALQVGIPETAVHTYLSLEQAAEFVRTLRQPGDLILLTGQTSDHVSRILHAQSGPVACWRSTCRIPLVCDSCSELRPGTK